MALECPSRAGDAYVEAAHVMFLQDESDEIVWEHSSIFSQLQDDLCAVIPVYVFQVWQYVGCIEKSVVDRP